jgi:hypothetical protein
MEIRMRRRDFLAAAIFLAADGCVPKLGDAASTAPATSQPSPQTEGRERSAGRPTQSDSGPDEAADLQTADGVNEQDAVAGDADAADAASTNESSVFPPAGALWYVTHSTSDPEDEWDPSGGDGGFPHSGRAWHENSSDYARSGSKSLKLTIDTSAGKSGARAHRYGPEMKRREMYFSVWRYYPQLVTPDRFWNNMQIKSRRVNGNGSVDNDVHWVLNIDNRPGTGAMYYYLSELLSSVGGEDRWHHQTKADIPVGRWVNIEWHLVQSTDGRADGRVQVWQDGVELWDFRNVRTRMDGSLARWGVTNYSTRLRPAKVSTYADDCVISTSRVWSG